MIEISFEMRPDQIKNAQERAIFENVRNQLVRPVGSVRDPMTGAAPKLRVKGNSLNDLNIEVEGSAELIEEAPAARTRNTLQAQGLAIADIIVAHRVQRRGG